MTADIDLMRSRAKIEKFNIDGSKPEPVAVTPAAPARAPAAAPAKPAAPPK